MNKIIKNSNSLYHVSENPAIKKFEPRPAPSYYESITGDVVFAINDKLLHNYLLPRECPRVTYYPKHDTSQHDRIKFLGNNNSKYVIVVENKWLEVIMNKTLFCYEFPSDKFTLLDKGAGYYISYETITPSSVHSIYNILDELNKRNIELRFLPSIINLAQDISNSTMQFSNIRMRKAT